VRADAARVLGAATVVPNPAPPAPLVALGRRLYFETALSAGRDLSCASCHDPARAWAGGRRTPGGRDVPSLLGASRPGPFFLDGRAATLDDAVLSELRDPRAMGLDDRAVSARLDALPEGPALLDDAGPAGADAERVARALAAFLRVEAVYGESAFDRAVARPESYPESAARGLALFVGKGRCASCHSGPWLSDGNFYRVGLRDDDPLDRGREAVTPVRQMRGAFRTPPLRDVARTAPYMHDGALPSLRAVVDFFDRGGDEALGLSHDIAPIGLTAGEKADLVAFLESLNGDDRRVAAPPAPTVRPGYEPRAFARRARSALTARDRPALRDAADAWSRALLRRRAARAGAADCFTDAAAAAGDLAAMSDTGRGWTILATRLDLAEEWQRECDFRASGGRDAVDGTGAEELLSRVQDLLDARREAAGDGPKVRACREGFTFDGLLTRLRERPYDDDAEQNVTKQALVYAWMDALRRGDPQVCDRLDFTSMAVGSARTGAQRCRELYTDMAGARALFDRDPAYATLCAQNVRVSYPEVPDADASEVCGLIAAKVDDPRELCSRLSPRWIPESLRGACEARFRLFSRGGGPADCEALDAGPSLIHEQCLDMGAFAQARAAGDAGRCGASALCRLLMGEGAADEAKQLEVVRDLACRAPPAPASMARVLASLDRADAALAGRAAALPPADRQGAADLDALVERSARLRAAAFRVFSGPDFRPGPY
jgi:cytochrome c peroxidase